MLTESLYGFKLECWSLVSEELCVFIFCPQLSSLSIEDQEDIQFPFAMRDLPPVSHSAGQLHMTDHQMAEEPSSERFSGFPSNPPFPRPIPCLPCSPKVPPRAKPAGLNSQIPPLPMRSPVVSQVSVDSPLSPASRPRSPWGRFDPYDSPEVSAFTKLVKVFLNKKMI